MSQQRKGKNSPKFINREGEKFTTTEGFIIEIVESFGAKNCTIKFENGVVVKNLEYGQIKRGEIKNLHYKSIYKIGYLGVGKYRKATHYKIYTTWYNMMQRGYSKLFKEKYPTYKDVTVCEEWHNFQNFAKWYEENYKEGFDLDKDILIKGNKIYSPETCCFVPQEINNLLSTPKNGKKTLPLGVIEGGKKFISSFRKNKTTTHLGTFSTSEEAFQAYKIAKEVYIKEMADKWKDKIAENVYKALINYKI